MDNLEQYLPSIKIMALSVWKRLPACTKVDVDDLVQAGCVGLCQAAERYDGRNDVKFKTFANRRIYGAMMDALREEDFMPRLLRTRVKEAQASGRELDGKLAMASASGVDSLDAAMGEEGGVFADMLAASSPDPLQRCMKAQRTVAVREAVVKLRPRQAQVLHLYYWLDMTGAEIGAAMGVVESRVSQIRMEAHARLRKELRGFA